MNNNKQPLIEAVDALALLHQPGVKFVDATWYMPNVPTKAYDVYLNEHIPGAIHFDIDKVADHSIDLPHMYPSLQYFESSMSILGIGSSDQIIVYDRSTFVASARVWWMFLSFGHENVKVLNGGLKAWKNVGGSVASGAEVVAKQGSYAGRAVSSQIIDRERVRANMSSANVAIVDARSQGRFDGTEPEPRPGLRGGHIPGSLNLYYGDVMDSAGMMHGAERIQKILDDLSVDSSPTIVTTCGSGVTAAILLLGIYQVRQKGLTMYDGSWTEWALHPESPIESTNS